MLSDNSCTLLAIMWKHAELYVQPTRISSRHKGKRPRYAEPGASGSDADAMDMDDSDVGEATQKLPKLSQQGTPSLSKRRKRYTSHMHAHWI